jgi:hypothetical protein
MRVPTTIPNNNMAVKLTFNSKGNVREASKKVLGRFHPPQQRQLLESKVNATTFRLLVGF